MGKRQRILLGLILLASNGIWGGSVLCGQETPLAKVTAAKENGQCTLSFQYLEGPGLSPPNAGAQERYRIISTKERNAWVDQARGKPDVWMMKEPERKFHLFGPTSRDFFGVEERGRPLCRLLCNYQFTLECKGPKIDLDLGVHVWMGEPTNDLSAAAHLELAEGETLVLQSPHPKTNIDRVLLVDVKKRPLPPSRMVRLELLRLEGDLASAHRPNWSCFDGRYQSGVPKREVEKWLRQSGTTLEAQASKRTFKDLKNTESWTIVDNKYDAPTEVYSEMMGVLIEFCLFKKITMVDFTEEDRITKHAAHVELVPDPANENAPCPFVLKSDFFRQRGVRSGSGAGAVNHPKPGHYLAIDTTKPHAQNWTMLLIRAVEDN